jgi:P-type Cu+ transporter
MEKITLKINGMSCASCAANIEKGVEKLPGVQKSQVNFATTSGYFEFTNVLNEKQIIQTIEELGFSCEDRSFAQQSQTNKKSLDEDSLKMFFGALILSILVMLFAMGPFKNWPDRQWNWVIQLVLTFPVYFFIGKKFQLALFRFFTKGTSNMNTLIGMGTSAAFLYSLFVTALPGPSQSLGLAQRVYFEAVGMIISFVYLGQFFEGKAKRKAKDALESLLSLSSKKAMVKVDGSFIEKDIHNVSRGDILRVRPGEKISVDGEVVEGSSYIDEAMISGEPASVKKAVGDSLFAGTINGDSLLDYKALKVGTETLLSQIIQYVENAQNSKPQIQRYADKVSGVFTPVVMSLALVTFFVWKFFGPEPSWGLALSNFIAVLVIACPCALGLATPLAVVVATGKASLKGLLIGGGAVIEKAHGIDAIVFDKTGTLTEGKPKVLEMNFLLGTSEEQGLEILQKVATIEQFSEHPLAASLVEYAKNKSLSLFEPDSFEAIKGKGVEATIKNEKFMIGNLKLMREHNITGEEHFVSGTVGSEVFVAINGSLVALIVIGDKIKEQASQVVSSLKSLGLKTWMISGDNHKVSKDVAYKCGIDEFIAGVLPLEKASHIQKIQESGYKVMMIGDGINDAPALALADLSLAMGTGTDVAMEASDVVIVKGNLSLIVDFMILSRRTLSIIKQNLFLSFAYNTVLIPVAAGVLTLFDGPLLPPVLASVAMGLSSISVVTNSLRIRSCI